MPKTSHQTGLIAKSLCRLSLRLRLYRVVASRYRSPMGEIDIVATRGKTLVLIEVKARASQREALEAVQQRQRERLERAANDFLARHPGFSRHDVRFDVMLVTPRRLPLHIKDAWRP